VFCCAMAKDADKMSVRKHNQRDVLLNLLGTPILL